MDELMLELELLRQMETEMTFMEEDQNKKRTSPYQNAEQEAMGQLAAMFDDIDEILMSIELEDKN